MNICQYCGEPILPEEEGHSPRVPGHHRECAFRAVGGSVAHIERRCSCFVPGSTENDPPGMTLRQAAEAAITVAWNRRHLQ